MAADLAPDLAGQVAGRVEAVDKATLADLVPLVPHTGVVAIARRPRVDLAAALASPARRRSVLLEQPRNMGNIGACIRVAAAAGAAALITTGENDPWHPDAVRGAAGLQFALPVAKVETLPQSDRPLLAIDPEGEELAPGRSCRSGRFSPSAPSATGSAARCFERAEARVSIPMREGVSSLNLATSVAIVLFAMRIQAT